MSAHRTARAAAPRRALTILLLFASPAASAMVLGTSGCKVKDPPPITEQFSDDFERDSLGGNYYATGEGFEIRDGRLHAAKSYNHPLWLRKRLPENVTIEFDAWAGTKTGDIKVEFYGDGSSYAKNRGAYHSTGYVAVFGGWSNSKSLLARKDEHGKELSVDATKRKVIPNKKYHWKIVRNGGHVEWSIDGAPFLTYEDADPLTGSGHSYFAVANWEAETWFDNLVITPLAAATD